MGQMGGMYGTMHGLHVRHYHPYSRLLHAGMAARLAKQQAKLRRKRLRELKRAGQTTAPGQPPRIRETVIPVATHAFEPPLQRPDLHAAWRAVHARRSFDTTTPQPARLTLLRAAGAPVRPATTRTTAGEAEAAPAPPTPRRAPATPPTPMQRPAQSTTATTTGTNRLSVARPSMHAPLPPRRDPMAAASTPAPTPQPAGYTGSMDELLLALTSNGFKRPVALAKIHAADLTREDTLATALVKCLRATA